MDKTWTLHDLVQEVGRRLAALPAPTNGQVRAVPDDRTIRYYAAIGLLDRPAAMRGRTALYSARHLAQVIAIKRMQTTGKTLAEIQALWPSLDDATLGRMTGVALAPASGSKPRAGRAEFWKRAASEAVSSAAPAVPPPLPVRAVPTPSGAEIELRIEISPRAYLTVGVADGVSLSSADVRALRAAAAPLVTELARRGLTAHATPEEES